MRAHVFHNMSSAIFKGLSKRNVLMTTPASLSRVVVTLVLHQGTLSSMSFPYLAFIEEEIRALEKYL